MLDMFGLTLLALGVEPANATIDDVTAAQQKLLDRQRGEQFRGYYGNDYYDALAAGDLVASVAWSGDISQMQLSTTRTCKFVIPEDGGMRWNDNMAIPKGSTEHIDDAHKLMDYWYTLDAAALAVRVHRLLQPGGRRRRTGSSSRRPGRAGAGDNETADQLRQIAPTRGPDAGPAGRTRTRTSS